MGFFAKCCSECGKSVVSSYKVRDHRARPWESDAVALLPNGDIHCGIYDGYGRVGNVSLVEPWQWDDVKMLHARCWQKKNEPEYADVAESKNCPGQGYFDWS